MEISKINTCFFSPNGTTQTITEELNKVFDLPVTTYDLLRYPLSENVSFSSKDLFIIGMPVHMGRIPSICVDMINNIKGNNSLAIALVVYGNREYEDALVELTDLLNTNGFSVIAGGAFIAQHSIFPSIAKGRPDKSDLEFVKSFGENCINLIYDMDILSQSSIHVKGNRPYRLANPIPLKPKSNNNCINCGLCSKLCPTNSILQINPSKINKETCISCGACISNCPYQARYFGGIVHKMAQSKFKKSNSSYKSPQVFYINS